MILTLRKCLGKASGLMISTEERR